MQVHRIYEPTFSSTGIIELEGENSHIVQSVLRLKRGSSLSLLNGKGLTGEGVLIEVGKKKAMIQVEKVQISNPLLPKLILFQALPKADKLEWVIQKGVEWGVEKIILLTSEHSVP